jgi:hypothetical protein
MRKTATIERVFSSEPRHVYSAYWNLESWPKALENILGANAEYDDGIHQYFTMVVTKDGGRETVHGVRIGTPYERLELCQLEPPPGFLVMRGEWRFEPVATASGTGTRVSVERVFATKDPAAEDTTATVLEALLVKNLVAFDAYLTRETV